ncbi:MAG: FAD-dependent oxidoreductase [Pseudomonadota bacterium]
MEPPVTVLGAGIVGICTALALVERGFSVRVVDRTAPGQETSYGNAGVISPWSVVPQAMPGTWRQIPKLMFGTHKPLSVHPRVWLRMIPWGVSLLKKGAEQQVRDTSEAMSTLCAPSIDIYQRYLSDAGATHLIKSSIYVHAYRDGSKASLDTLDAQIRREKGAEMEVIGVDALHRLEPYLNRSFKGAVLIKGQARAISPGEICTALADLAQARGVAFVTRNVRSLERRSEGWSVICDTDRFPAKAVVIAMGVWSRELLRSLGVSVPLMAERGYHVEYPDPQIMTENSIMDTDAKVIASSMAGGLRVAGQAEFAPIDAPPNESKIARLHNVARAMFPDLRAEQKKSWMGRRPSFPDSLPALGPVDGHEGLFANFGHSHYGLMMAPKSGQIVAAQLARDTQNKDLSAFSLARFQ